MRRLILYRHAKTEPKPAGMEDIDRKLTARGQNDSRAIGRLLARAGYAPDLALVSPSVRTRQTWDLAKAAFPQCRIEICDALYNAESQEVMGSVAQARDRADTIVVVGHNPSLQEVAIDLVIEGDGRAVDVERLSAAFPTSTCVVFVMDESGRATLIDSLHPGVEGGLGASSAQ